ncbi:MAG: leucine--tRNA ligase [Candidatus Njordarchaeota archaeon]
MVEVTLEFLRQVEKKWQRIWKERKIYEPDIRDDKPKFFITVPYPYTSGPLHVGHGRTYLTGDIIARFKRLCGFNVLFPMAFHVTGMPVLSISDRIARGDPKVRRQYREYINYYVSENVDDILESFRDPIKVATFFASNIQKDFESIGLGIDWRRKFHTAEQVYNKFVEWQYYKLRERGLITKGEHFVRYCVLHKQSVGEDDIADGDVNPVRIQEFVAIKFEYGDGFILASTLRPETLYGATNMWVNPNAKYLKIRNCDGEIWYVSREAYEKLKYQYPCDYEVISEIDGKEFVGKHVVSPLGDRLIILPADFVDPDRASGFVYSEPADAPYDYVALMDLKNNLEILKEYNIAPEEVLSIVPKKIINMPGIKGYHAEEAVKKYGIENQMDPKLEDVTEEVYKQQFYDGIMNENAGILAGMPVREARDKIRNKLLEERKAIIFYETSRKAVCRGGGKIVIARIKDQWFIDYSKDWWKEESKDWLNKMLIYPTKYKKLFEDTIDWLALRPCARGRGLGTRLPFDDRWVIESLSDSTIYMAFYTIANIIRENNISAENLIPEVFDYVFLGKGNIDEVSDKSGIPKNVLELMQKSFRYWYPNDLRHTATPHITNHLTFFIMHHVAIFPQDYWPSGITLNETVIREGTKMSKSRGNVIPLADIAKKYSADLFRLYVVSGADLDGVVDWREPDVEKLKRILLGFVSLVLSAAKASDESFEYLRIDKWFLSRFYRRLSKSKGLLDSFKIREFVVSMFYEVLNDISYLKRRTSEEHALKVVRKILKDWIVILSPIIPHICEEVWSKINDDPDKWSINLAEWPSPKAEYINEEIEYMEEIVASTIAIGRDLLRILKIRPKNAILIVAANWKYDLFEYIKEVIGREQRKIGEIMKNIFKHEKFRKYSKDVSQIIKRLLSGKINIPRIFLTQKKEFDILADALDYIKKELGLEQIRIEIEEKIEDRFIERAKRALPSKPIFIFLE